MASNLYRLLSSSPIKRSELSSSASCRRLICSTAQLLQNQLPETKESPISEDKERIHNQIEDEKKQPQPSEDEEIDESVNKVTGEYGGPRGPEPTRYGDWEKNGRCSDF